MLNKFTFKVILIFLLLGTNQTNSAPEKIELIKQNWPFNGVFGRFDKSSLQRGYLVYKEVCASCHGLKHVSYRDLTGIGLTKDEIKSIAGEYFVMDGPNDEGEMFEREAKLSDKFVNPYENDNQARLANNGAYPPDLSLMVKARAGGADYLFSLLNGYKDFPEGFEASEGMYYNEYYPGKQIAMPSPIMDDIVEYNDGTDATHVQIARDVTSFLAWTAEPELEERKSLGVKTLFFLILLTIMLLGVQRKVWKDVN